MEENMTASENIEPNAASNDSSSADDGTQRNSASHTIIYIHDLIFDLIYGLLFVPAIYTFLKATVFDKYAILFLPILKVSRKKPAFALAATLSLAVSIWFHRTSKKYMDFPLLLWAALMSLGFVFQFILVCILKAIGDQNLDENMDIKQD
ncbi:Hypothetical predicted protein [Cloeon dipterum]|uniref:Uncharacterized protein n=1 Tax=Cloeon dipterum TaxID=197152 RepID=A0A8S1DXJ9_9INSE|nr:Hypothetical predicted protein [Cloeon dipterum]